MNWFETVYSEMTSRLTVFLVTFFVIVTVSYGILFVLDFIPEAPNGDESANNDTVEEMVSDTNNTQQPVVKDENLDSLPATITFDSLNKTVTVLNPTSRTVADLDNALLSGAVRHPDSAGFSSPGNIFILGHSSYLPNVFNDNFQAFNGIQNLTWGDTIRLRSTDTEYVYQVDRVYKAKTTEVSVPLTSGVAKLTLATCNSFGTKDDRFMVEATLVEENPL